MLSPPDTRRIVERVLRTLALVTLGGITLLLLRPRTPEGVETVRADALTDAFERWSTAQIPPAVHLEARGVMPSAAERAWLRALRRVGANVSWTDGNLPHIVVATEPLADPRGTSELRVVHAGADSLHLADDAGMIATFATSRGAAAVRLPWYAGTLQVHGAGRTAASTRAPADALFGGALVLGAADWESKYIIASLEERGWKVDARLEVAPDVARTQGETTPDTARHAVVIVTASVPAATAQAIRLFVESGGGLIVTGGAAPQPELQSLLPARTGGRRASTGPSSPAYRRLTNLTGGSTALLVEDGDTIVAARVVGNGRVLQIGYEETWRWRLAPTETTPDHEAWWARTLATAARVRWAFAERRNAHATLVDPAPYAALVDALGPPASESAHATGECSAWLPLLFGLCVTALVAEWAMRRAKGAV